jgi:hypothetical protein
MIPHLACAVGAVQQERRSGFRRGQHIQAIQKPELMAGYKIGARDQVARVQRLRAKPQVRHRHRAGFLGIVNEVSLREMIGLLADDLDRILVGAHGAVRAQPVEQRPDRARIFGRKLGIEFQAGMRDVIRNSDGEMIFGSRLLHLVVNCLHHTRTLAFSVSGIARSSPRYFGL